MQYYGDLLRKLTNSNTTEICEFFVKKCMMNARNHAANEGMKRFFMVCAVSANDGIKELLVKNDLTFSGYWAHRRYFAKVKDAVPVVVKSYLSCLLLVLAAQKELIREKTGLSEAELLHWWCTIFKYTDDDKAHFDKIVKKAGFGEAGVKSIFSELNEICHRQLNGGMEENIPCTEENRDFLLYRVGEDAYRLTLRLREWPGLQS